MSNRDFQAVAKAAESEKKGPVSGKWRKRRKETQDQTKGNKGRSERATELPRCFSPRKVTQGLGKAQKEVGCRAAASPRRSPKVNANMERAKTFQCSGVEHERERGSKEEGQFQWRTVGSAKRPEATEYRHKDLSKGWQRPQVTSSVAADRTPRTEEAAECR